MDKKCLLCQNAFKIARRGKDRKYCGHQCYWKSRIGNKPSNWVAGLERKCGICGKMFRRSLGYFKKHKVGHCSSKCMGIWQKSAGLVPWNKGLKGFRSGEINNKWKGKNASYSAFHHWMKANFGKANKCLNREVGILNFICSEKSNIYHWALLHGMKYDHQEDNYIPLCVSCHGRYDRGIGKNFLLNKDLIKSLSLA